jgi:phospholipase C
MRRLRRSTRSSACRPVEPAGRGGGARRRRFARFVAPPGFEQKYLGPRDANSPFAESLLSGFDKARLSGALPPLPAAYATIPDDIVNAFPHYCGKGCAAIGVTPEDVRQGSRT